MDESLHCHDTGLSESELHGEVSLRLLRGIKVEINLRFRGRPRAWPWKQRIPLREQMFIRPPNLSQIREQQVAFALRHKRCQQFCGGERQMRPRHNILASGFDVSSPVAPSCS